MELKTVKDLFIHELKDVLSAEKQLVKALPKLAKAAENEELSSGFQQHLEETKEHVERVEQILKDIGASSRAQKCMGMEGLLAEGQQVIEDGGEAAVVDVAIAGAAQKVEHYEIVAYTGLVELANALELDDAAEALEETLDEEKATDEKLKELEESLLEEAQSLSAGQEEEEE